MSPGSFDFVFLKSVFTHMRPAGVEHYLREMRRVMKPGACCLATAFLLDQESNQLIASGQSSLNLVHDLGGYQVLDPKFPESAVGLPEASFKDWCEQANLILELPLRYGSWCGRSRYLSYQDIVLLRAPSLIPAFFHSCIPPNPLPAGAFKTCFLVNAPNSGKRGRHKSAIISAVDKNF